MDDQMKPMKPRDYQAHGHVSPFTPDPHFHARKQLERQDELGGYAGIDPKAARRAVRRGGVTGGV